MSWGIAETASAFEKLRAESADYLGGLNSCGLIDYDTYSQAFDFYMDLLQKMYGHIEKEQMILVKDLITQIVLKMEKIKV